MSVDQCYRWTYGSYYGPSYIYCTFLPYRNYFIPHWPPMIALAWPVPSSYSGNGWTCIRNSVSDSTKWCILVSTDSFFASEVLIWYRSQKIQFHRTGSIRNILVPLTLLDSVLWWSTWPDGHLWQTWPLQAHVWCRRRLVLCHFMPIIVLKRGGSTESTIITLSDWYHTVAPAAGRLP